MKVINLMVCAFLTLGQILEQEDKSGSITSCWDTSFSMSERDIEKDFWCLMVF